MSFAKVGKLTDVPPGTAKSFTVNDREITVCNTDGELYAIDDICSHEDGSLEQGDLDGCEIECPLHGARFDVRTGDVTEGPAVLPIDIFDVRINGEDIEISI